MMNCTIVADVDIIDGDNITIGCQASTCQTINSGEGLAEACEHRSSQFCLIIDFGMQ